MATITAFRVVNFQEQEFGRWEFTTIDEALDYLKQYRATLYYPYLRAEVTDNGRLVAKFELCDDRFVQSDLHHTDGG